MIALATPDDDRGARCAGCGQQVATLPNGDRWHCPKCGWWNVTDANGRTKSVLDFGTAGRKRHRGTHGGWKAGEK